MAEGDLHSMTLLSVCATSLVRSLGIAAATLAAASVLRPVCMSGRGQGRLLRLALLCVFLTPSAVIGYAWSNFSLSLVRHPVWNGLFYSMLVWMKLTPLAVLVLYFAPGFLSPSALHCHRLLASGGSARRFFDELWIQALAGKRACATAFALALLLAFQEFEMVSLFQVRSWTVALFDAHAGGLALGDSLKLAALPLAISLAILAPMLWMLTRERRLPSMPETGGPAPSGIAVILTWMLAGLSLLFVTGIPMGMVLRDTIRGASALAGNFVIGRDIIAGLCFAAASGFAAYAGAGFLLDRKFRAGPACVASLPGLMGTLTLALIIVALFQHRPLARLYDTPLPLFMGLFFLLLPFAALLRVLLAMRRPEAAIHAAELMEDSGAEPVRERGRSISDFLRARGRFWALFLLFCWGYFDVTASSILAPSGTVPIFVRLYNLMHYGHITVLSGMICAALVAPLLALAAAAIARAVYLRKVRHA